MNIIDKDDLIEIVGTATKNNIDKLESSEVAEEISHLIIVVGTQLEFMRSIKKMSCKEFEEFNFSDEISSAFKKFNKEMIETNKLFEVTNE